MIADVLRDRIQRFRSGGINGPKPSGFLVSISETGSVMLIVHDLGLSENAEVSIQVGNGFIRILHRDAIVLQAADEDEDTKDAILNAESLFVLEMGETEPLRIHPASIG